MEVFSMRRITVLLTAVFLVFLVMGCSSTAEKTTLSGDEDITMANMDEYLNADARFIDLRDFDDMFNGGYIAGFEVVPFFQYLEGRAVERNNGWEFSSADIIKAAMLDNIFGPKDREVFVMCSSGARSGYTKEALEAIGYEKVYNIGGIRDYQGDHKIFGDEDFTLQL
jgi:rhodanese-related sulfurtransferase